MELPIKLLRPTFDEQTRKDLLDVLERLQLALTRKELRHHTFVRHATCLTRLTEKFLHDARCHARAQAAR